MIILKPERFYEPLTEEERYQIGQRSMMQSQESEDLARYEATVAMLENERDQLRERIDGMSSTYLLLCKALGMPRGAWPYELLEVIDALRSGDGR